MNALTDAELHALDIRAGALEVAELGKNLILVPFSRLQLWQGNVRKTKGTPVDDLAASILRVGLLQNLVVVLAQDGWHYDVVAGGRRLAALRLLVKKRRISKDKEVPCLLVADASAATMSLVENVQREAMHPADQFEAFAALVAEGRPVEDIAADFHVTPLVVRRRLRLANVSPRLMAAFREDEVTLEQLMALSITDDHAAQDAAFFDAPDWQRHANVLRSRLTEREMPADYPVVRFVTLAAYEAAGGAVRRDLFAEGDRGVYVADIGLLEYLARQRMDGDAQKVRAEGWSWVEVSPRLSPVEVQEFQRAPRARRTPGKREAQRIEKLQAKLAAVEEAMAAEDAEDAEDDDGQEHDEDRLDALNEEQTRLEQQLQTVEDGLLGYAPEVMALSGAVLLIDRNGAVAIHRGLLREAEAQILRQRHLQGAEEVAGSRAGKKAERKAAGISDRLARQLSAHRTAALQIETARHPHVALAALVHGMAQTVLQDCCYGHDLPLRVRVEQQDRLDLAAPDWPESPAAVALREMRDAWAEKLPAASEQLFAALLVMPQQELLALLAVCVAPTVNVLTMQATLDQPGAEIAKAVGLDMAQWWKPTAESYFQHVPKAAILESVSQFSPSDVSRLSKMKKAAVAAEAERLAAAAQWMPVVFRSDEASRHPVRAADEPLSPDGGHEGDTLTT